MKRLKKYVAFAVVFLLVFALLPSVALGNQGTEFTFEGEGFSVEFRLNSFWDTGYNAEIRITNTGSEGIYEWVLNINRDMGLSENWLNGGRVAHQDASQTTIGALDWNSYIPAGGSVSLWLYGTHDGDKPVPTDYRLTSKELREVPAEDFTVTVNRYSQWADRFNGSISLINTTDRVMKGWQVSFDITGGGAELTDVWNAEVLQEDTSSATLKHRPRSNQSFHPDMNLHLGMMGTRAQEDFDFENITLWEKVALPYDGWSDSNLDNDPEDDQPEDNENVYIGFRPLPELLPQGWDS
ncbi:MAG: cellulose binding domain-containing protein [Defluviitaleaceae bacterium]|nr:cellulose binding domain-containing protein [Defluviitaleaceae bacterium]